ncbi:hypothetical protein ACFPRL_10440 [Pseudoclavibacter helvolus]
MSAFRSASAAFWRSSSVARQRLLAWLRSTRAMMPAIAAPSTKLSATHP